jgi:prepilin-type N-terminal cleavage/methylation domain-containing protein
MSRGFTLVELIVTIAIIATILAIASMNFRTTTQKANIEAEIRMMHADLMTARTAAIYTRRSRSVTMTTSLFSVYSSTVTTGTPLVRRELRNHVTFKQDGATATSAQLDFDAYGTTSVVSTSSGLAICVDPADNPGTFDSIVVQTTRFYTGKRQNDCNATTIVIR